MWVVLLQALLQSLRLLLPVGPRRRQRRLLLLRLSCSGVLLLLLLLLLHLLLPLLMMAVLLWRQWCGASPRGRASGEERAQAGASCRRATTAISSSQRLSLRRRGCGLWGALSCGWAGRGLAAALGSCFPGAQSCSEKRVVAIVIPALHLTVL